VRAFVSLLLCFVMLGAAPQANLSVTVQASPTPSTLGMKAGCPLYPTDARLYKDISTDAVASTSAADIQSALTGSDGTKTSGWASALGEVGSSTYVLHVLANGPSEPQTTPTMTTGHTNPGPLPIGQYTSQNALTGGVGDESMEIIAKGYTTASGCRVFDGYDMGYIGTAGVYSSTGMWNTYSSCNTDPSSPNLMIGETCNSNVDRSGLEIAAGIQPEEFDGTAGWTQGSAHAMLIEDPCASSYHLCEDGSKMRLRVCGYTDGAVGGDAAGANCVTAPSASAYPNAYNLVMHLGQYGAFNSDNGCCFNLSRQYQPQSGDSGFSFPGMPSIHLIDFNELASGDSV
jgi:hypothetical protein